MADCSKARTTGRWNGSPCGASQQRECELAENCIQTFYAVFSDMEHLGVSYRYSDALGIASKSIRAALQALPEGKQ